MKEYRNENNELHREDGPAFEYADGTKAWYLNGERHREDGPAVEDANGHKEWYLNGEEINIKDNLIDLPVIEQEKIKLINQIKFIKVNNNYLFVNHWLKQDKEFYKRYRLLFKEIENESESERIQK